MFLAWLLFAGLNAWLMFLLPGEETVPFHFVWISLSLVYGLQPWSLQRTGIVLLAVCIVTGAALVGHVRNGVIGWEETTEVPLMTMVFLAMVIHVRRRAAAVHSARTAAESEYRMRQALHRFVKFASHELRTPVTVARGYSELISQESDIRQARDDAGVVLDELRKLERIAARLLAMAEVDESSALRPERIDLDLVLRQTLKRWTPVADRAWRLHTTAGSVMADPERLVTALDCLLDNAVRYTVAGDQISIDARRLGGRVEVRVSDTGSGIAADELAFVFDTFRSGERGGTGLGLAVVKAVLEAHGGSVRAQSRVGVGSTFTFDLLVDGPRRAPRGIHSIPAPARTG